MKLDELFPKRYVSGDDLQGKSPTLEIERVQIEKMYHPGKREEVQKAVIRFKGCEKGVVLSKTLAFQIAAIVGSDDTAAWPGKSVTLVAQPVKVGKDTRLGIRAQASK
jgi:hypothetical protein